MVSVYDNLTNPGQAATQRAELYISKWDNCSETSLLSVSNYDPTTGESQFAGTIQFSPDLSSATVNGSAAMYDWNSGSLSYTATVNLTFKGYGSTFTMVDNHRLQAPGYVENAHFTGKNRSAEASGTFTDPDGNNAAAVSTTNAVLADSTGGTVRIYKG